MEGGNRRTAMVARNDVATRLGGEQAPPVLRAREIGLVLLRFAQRPRELRDGEIVGAVFERAGSGGVDCIGGDVTFREIVTQPLAHRVPARGRGWA